MHVYDGISGVSLSLFEMTGPHVVYPVNKINLDNTAEKLALEIHFQYLNHLKAKVITLTITLKTNSDAIKATTKQLTLLIGLSQTSSA